MGGQVRRQGDRPVNLPRLLNAMADAYTALRLAGWSAEEASRITTEAARNAVNQIPIRPYPEYKDPWYGNCNRYPGDPDPDLD